jgi:hypothetical protein
MKTRVIAAEVLKFCCCKWNITKTGDKAKHCPALLLVRLETEVFNPHSFTLSCNLNFGIRSGYIWNLMLESDLHWYIRQGRRQRKLSLCLTKYQAMKYHLLTQSPFNLLKRIYLMYAYEHKIPIRETSDNSPNSHEKIKGILNMNIIRKTVSSQ